MFGFDGCTAMPPMRAPPPESREALNGPTKGPANCVHVAPPSVDFKTPAP